MKKIGIIVDSSCGLSQKQANERGWGFLPLMTTIDGKDYQDGIDMDSDKFYSIMNLKMNVKTSFSPNGFATDLLTKFSKEYTNVIVYTLSKGLSAQNNNIRLIARELPNVHVIESLAVGTSIVHECESIEKEVDKGELAIEEIVKLYDERAKAHYALVFPFTMDWLVKGGRVSGVAAAMAKLLHIQPVIKLENGKLEKHDKGKKFEKTLYIQAKDFASKYKDENYKYFVYHANAKNIDTYVEKLKTIFDRDFDVTLLPPVIACHTGPDTVVLMVTKK